MNTGIIATRYATALLKLVEETGSGELVAAQVQVIEKALDEVPDFRRAVDEGSADGNLAFVALYGNGQGLAGPLKIGLHPHTEGDKVGVQ